MCLSIIFWIFTAENFKSHKKHGEVLSTLIWIRPVPRSMLGVERVQICRRPKWQYPTRKLDSITWKRITRKIYNWCISPHKHFRICIICPLTLITARKRSLGQGNIFTPVCHSVHGGGEYLVGTPPGQVHPPGQVLHPPGQVHPPGRYTPPPRYGQRVGGMHPTGMQSCYMYSYGLEPKRIFTARNSSCEKVIFSQACDFHKCVSRILSMGAGGGRWFTPLTPWEDTSPRRHLPWQTPPSGWPVSGRCAS